MQLNSQTMNKLIFLDTLNCPFKCEKCPAKSGKVLDAASHLPNDVVAPELEIYTCPDCGIGATYPYVSNNSIHKMYANRESNDFQPGDTGFVVKLKQWFAKKEASHAVSIATIDRPILNILDYGCGNGSFAVALTQTDSKLSIAAMDFDVDPPHMLVNSNVRYLRMSQASEVTGAYDLIFCRHVLEHSDAPVDFLLHLKSLLALGGVIYIEVPNFNSPIKRLFGRNYLLFYAPYHFFHYTEKSINTLFEKSGVKVIKLKMGLMPTIGRSLHSRYSSFPYFPFFLLGLFFYPFEFLIRVFTGQGTVLRCWVAKDL